MNSRTYAFPPPATKFMRAILVSLAVVSCNDHQPPSASDLVLVKIVGMYPYEEGGVGVFLQGEGPNIVPIVIGELEALALQMALSGETTPRPVAYDLVVSVLDRFGGSIGGLVVHSIVDNVFHGNLEIVAGDGAVSIDCRPSDGMVLATRAEAPIYVTVGVLEKAGTRATKAKKVLWIPERGRPKNPLLQQHEPSHLRPTSLN